MKSWTWRVLQEKGIGTKSDFEKIAVLGSESKIASVVSIAELFKVK